MVAPPGWSKARQHAGVHQLRGSFAMHPATAMHPVIALAAAGELRMQVILCTDLHTPTAHTCVACAICA